ncbi:MAG: LLM class flavin-dependent oxidoreductase [Actinomycetia bacterium]|nr:LLM class flavin-dependent oxidoreductase [Actinomycetes bacterium]
MAAVDGPPVGLVLGASLPPQQLCETAALGERLGFTELWCAEDYFFTGGISATTAALAATERVPIGLGIVSALVRHPAVLAMELATVAGVHPGRFMPGIGLGVPSWLDQMKLMPASPLTAMRECMSAVRRLLDGETLTEEGRYLAFDEVRLTHPADERVPLQMGVINPKMVELAGELADGLVLSVLAGVEYVRWARERLAAGAERAGRVGERHRVETFVLFSVDHDGQRAKDALRDTTAFYLAAVPSSALTDVYGVGAELLAMVEGGAERVRRELPAQWLEDLVVAGTPDECAEKIEALIGAGSDSVILMPTPAERAPELVELAAKEVLPRL